MTALPIGAAVLDVAARTLTGPDRTVRLTAQPARLLACLAERAGRMVPHADLVASLHDPYGRAGVRLMQDNLGHVRRALRASGSGAVATAIHGVGVRLRVPEGDTAAKRSGKAA